VNNVVSIIPGKLGASHPETSRLAAFANLPQRANQRLRALAAIGWATSGLADFELENFGITRSGACSRRLELQEMGLVQDSGRRVATPHGGEAIRWILTELGRDLLAEPTNEAVKLPPKQVRVNREFVVLDLDRDEVIDLFEASDRDDWKQNLRPYLQRADRATMQAIVDRIAMLLVELTLPNAVAEAVHLEHGGSPF
jgi:hypothetical protein